MSGDVGVVLLHGMLLPACSMIPFRNFLQQQGFDAHCVGYASRQKPFAGLTAEVAPKIIALTARYQTLHLVGHSMGGLIIRGVLAQHYLPNLGRVVQLGSPNGGSEIADTLRDYRFYRWLYGAAGQELGTRQRMELPAVEYPLGVIAGNRCVDPFSAVIFRRLGVKQHDGKVSVAATRVAGMRDHLTVPVSHTMLPYRPMVWRQTAYFLSHGCFAR